MSPFHRNPAPIIGHRRNGQPIHLLMGGSEGAPEGAPSGQGAPAPTGPPAPAPAPSGPTDDGTTLQIGDTDTDAAALAAKFSSEQLARMALNYRGEAASSRVNAKATAADEARAALLKDLAPGLKALGIVVPGTEEAPDAGALAEQLAAQAAEVETQKAGAKALALENGVLRYATEAGGNVQRLLDSKSFGARVAALDPTAADFAAKMQAEVKAAVKADPTLAAQGQAPVRSGSPIVGGSGAGNRDQGVSLADAVGLAYNR